MKILLLVVLASLGELHSAALYFIGCKNSDQITKVTIFS